MKALILGAGGFIGSHLATRLSNDGYFVAGADLKFPAFSDTACDDFIQGDLRDLNFCNSIFNTHRFVEVYQLAADMGGWLHIFSGNHDADIMHNSAMINLNIAQCAVENKVSKLFYSSSACIYPSYLQEETANVGLKESDAIPANPDSAYGWEKLFSETLYDSFQRNYNLNIRVARFHNIFGVMGTYDGGRQKAPADICRQVAKAKDGESITLWGDGKQTRSFLYIDECVEGVIRLMNSDIAEPLNIGSDEMISINDLAKMVIEISGKKNISIEYSQGQTGVRGRNSDNKLIKEKLGWAPSQPLRVGMEKTYNWISKQVNG